MPSFRRPGTGGSNLRLFSHEKAKAKAKAQREQRMNTRRRAPRTSAVFVDATKIFIATGTMPRSTQAARLIARRIRGESLTVRELCYLALEEPASGTTAQVISTMVRLITLLATVSTVLESIPAIVERAGSRPFVVLNFVFNSMFTVEACARVAAYQPFEQVVRDGFVWLDILTVVPFLIRLAVLAAAGEDLLTTDISQGQRVLEAFGSIRLLKLCRYDEGAALLMRAFSRSMAQLYVPMFMLLILVASCSTVVFHIERDATIDECVGRWQSEGVDAAFLSSRPEGVQWDCSVCDPAAAGNTSSFECATCRGYPIGHPECLGIRWAQIFVSIPHAMWFVLVTVTTVGYGDVSPVTWPGQLFIGVVMLLGVVFLAMPLSTVGNNFTSVWEERQLFKLQALVRQMLAENGMSPADCATAFGEFDQDQNGLIEVNEFRHFIDHVLGLRLRKPEFSALWRMLDTDGSGTVNFAEFSAVLFPNLDLEDVDEEPSTDQRRPTTGRPPAGMLRQTTQGLGDRRTGASSAMRAVKLSAESFKRAPSQPVPASKIAVLSQDIRTVGLTLSARQDEMEERLGKMEGLLQEMHARILEGPTRHRSGKRAHSSHAVDRPAAGSPMPGASAPAAATSGSGSSGDGSGGAESNGVSAPLAASCHAADGRDDSFFKEANGHGAHLPEACTAVVSKSAPTRQSEARHQARASFSLQDAGMLVVSGFGRDSHLAAQSSTVLSAGESQANSSLHA